MMIIVTKTRLNGIHEAVVLDGEFKDRPVALIVPSSEDRRRHHIIYEGLVMEAILLRHDGLHIDVTI